MLRQGRKSCGTSGLPKCAPCRKINQPVPSKIFVYPDFVVKRFAEAHVGSEEIVWRGGPRRIGMRRPFPRTRFASSPQDQRSRPIASPFVSIFRLPFWRISPARPPDMFYFFFFAGKSRSRCCGVAVYCGAVRESSISRSGCTAPEYGGSGGRYSPFPANSFSARPNS